MTLWLQPATYDTRAPGVATFGQTSTVDRRCDWLAAVAHCVGFDRESALLTGMKCKELWRVRFSGGRV